MSYPVIDIDQLLAPISDDYPAGTDPRADQSSSSLYYRTKDARNAARSAERAAVDLGGPAPEEWATVQDTAIEILVTQAKDLEIASWLVEALVRREGFAGLRDGLKVLSGIAGQYWESCFPELDEEDGIEGKVAPVSGLSGSGATGTLIQPVRLTPITRGSLESFSLWSYEQAGEFEKITDPDRREQRLQNGAVTMEQFMQSVSETPSSELHNTQQTVDECLAALAEMSAAFDAVAGYDAPPISALRDILQEISSAIRHVAADKLASVAYEEAAAAAAEASQEVTSDDGTVTTQTVVVRREGFANREEALQDLGKIAAYFRKTEPHSPISYTLEESVRRARMTLPELLAELAEDPSHTQRILLAAGIKPPESSSSDGY